jgi:hypothetical protein
MRQRQIPAWIALAILFTLGADAPRAADDDPWMGKPRREVVSLLGSPNKTKTGHDKEVLTYKLFRLDPGSALSPRVLVVDVPGVGLVGRVQPDPDAGAPKMDYEPTGFDEDGRPVPGGFDDSQTTSMSWDAEAGKLKRDDGLEDLEAPSLGAKLTLKFELDRDGRVASWSVSPKKQARPE